MMGLKVTLNISLRYLTTLTMLSISFLSSGFIVASEAFDPASGIVCKKPKSRLYKKENSNDALELELIADFSGISAKYGNYSKVKGVLKYNDSKDGRYYVPVELSGRGNSRGNKCSFKPFRMAFGTPELVSKIQALLEEKNIIPQSPDYLKFYYDAFLELPKSTIDGKPAKKTLFDRLGDDVKLVTHCGRSSNGGDWPGGLTEVDQDQRLLAEYYIYEVLSTLQTTVETARLAKIKYYGPNGQPVFTDANGDILPKYAFFREPPTSMAKRCQLLTTRPVDQNGQLLSTQDNIASYATASINNLFVINSDYSFGAGRQGHNTNYLYDLSGEKYFGVYDFDLAGAVSDFKGAINDIEAQEKFNYGSIALRSYFKNISSPSLALPIGNRFLQVEEKMKAIAESAMLNDQYKGRFQLWLNTQYKTLHEIVTGLEQKQNDTEPKE